MQRDQRGLRRMIGAVRGDGPAQPGRGARDLLAMRAEAGAIGVADALGAAEQGAVAAARRFQNARGRV